MSAPSARVFIDVGKAQIDVPVQGTKSDLQRFDSQGDTLSVLTAASERWGVAMAVLESSGAHGTERACALRGAGLPQASSAQHLREAFA